MTQVLRLLVVLLRLWVAWEINSMVLPLSLLKYHISKCDGEWYSEEEHTEAEEKSDDR